MKKLIFVLLWCSLTPNFALGCQENTTSANEQPETTLEENNSRYMFCRYCGKVCSDFAARRAHESICLQNPHHK